MGKRLHVVVADIDDPDPPVASSAASSADAACRCRRPIRRAGSLDASRAPATGFGAGGDAAHIATRFSDRLIYPTRMRAVMNRTALATIVGLFLGIALVFGNFGDMLVVALFGAIGYGLAKVLDGDVDVNALLAKARTPR